MIGGQREMAKIEIGAVAGHHFWGQADLQIARHCRCGDRRGYFISRKRLVDRAAFNYDPRLGWETDHWFEWVPPLEILDEPKS